MEMDPWRPGSGYNTGGGKGGGCRRPDGQPQAGRHRRLWQNRVTQNKILPGNPALNVKSVETVAMLLGHESLDTARRDVTLGERDFEQAVADWVV